MLDTRITAVVVLPTIYVFSTQTVADCYRRRSKPNLDKSAWNYNVGSGGITATDPLGNDTVYTGNSCSGVVSQIQYYSGSAAAGTLLTTVNKTYRSLPNPYPKDVNQWWVTWGPQLLASTTTTWPNGQQSQALITYDSGFIFTDTNGDHVPYGQTYTSSYGLMTSESHSDYYTGNPTNPPLLSTTNTNYLALSNSSYVTANILDLPSSVITTDGSGNKCAETDYAYDAPAQIVSSGVTQQHVSAPTPGVLGNLTSVTQQFSSTPCQPGASWSSLPPRQYTVYDTGMRNTLTDPLLHTTTFSYSTNFYGTYVTQTTMPSTSSPNPASHIVSGNYDFNTGLLTSFTDQNNNATSYTYDVMLRPTNVTYPSPDGGQTNFYYPSTTTVEMQKSIDGTRTTDSFTYYDGLGRECRSMSVNDESSPWDEVDTLYDAVGRVSFKSYPYQGAGTPPPTACSSVQPGDAFAYDPLGRVTQVTHSDNSTVLTSYTGRATSVQDEGNGTQRVQRISQVDGLGRLASVCEVASATQLGTGGTPGACGQDIAGTGFLTTYTYDALNNLTGVSQGGYLPRSFAYDSLSRLLSAANPESGTINYKYESDTNCPLPNSFPTLLVSKVDARGVRTCMQYDALDRLTQKNYSDGTSTASFNYDETSARSITLANTTGRMSSEATASPNPTAKIFSYDKLGRVKDNSQCTPQNCSASAVFPVTYTYDLLGDTLTATNGMGVTLTYPPYNRALRITGMTSSLSDSNHPGTLYSSPHYNGAGSVLSATIGNPGSSISETRSYDGRLRLTNITAGSLYTLAIPINGYAPDSDILQAIDSANLTWSYTYDSFNRLCNANQSATQPVCGRSALYTYDYDRFGNRWHQNGPRTMLYSSSGNNNRMDTYSYDAAGNLLNDGTTTYTYDSENRIISATNSTSGTSTYQYDADGRRIRKTTVAGGTVDFLYDLSGREITQVTSTGSWTRGEVYAGGRHLATYSGGTGGTTYFSFTDWLGTERARSIPGATTPCETITSLPFGDGQTITGSCGDPSPMHFTGKERDSESGLDNFGARYDSSQYGRFMSPTWSAKPVSVPYAVFSNPQSLNLYAYVQNNPVTNKDADGHWCIAGKWGTTCQPPPPPPPPPAQQEAQKQSTTSKVMQTAKDTVKKVENAHAAVQKWVADHPSVQIGIIVVGLVAGGGEAVEGEGAAVGEGAAEELPYSERVGARSAEDPGPNHNFPSSFDKEIMQNGQKTVGSDGYTQYNLRGSVNGREGTYEIGVKNGQIEHRFFRPDP
jgi:RHS repeat-associated protein